MMKPAADKLAAKLAESPVAVPSIPVFANADNAAHGTADEIRTALVRQLYSPVRWTQLIGKLKADGVTDIVECGPGRVLTGLLRRTAPEIAGHNIYDQATLEGVLGKLQ
jgi:[acyl-carrier-protein] S-malonyltransferase